MAKPKAFAEVALLLKLMAHQLPQIGLRGIHDVLQDRRGSEFVKKC